MQRVRAKGPSAADKPGAVLPVPGCCGWFVWRARAQHSYIAFLLLLLLLSLICVAPECIRPCAHHPDAQRV